MCLQDLAEIFRHVGESKIWVIAIDGPAGSGKSTVTQMLAGMLEIPYLDTGAFYRSVAWLAAQAGLEEPTPEQSLELIQWHTIGQERGRTLVDGQDVSAEIRTAVVDRLASRVAVIPTVRSNLVQLQRQWVADHGQRAVVEGRDVGTVIFPHAQLKLFLEADPDVRAERRNRQRQETGTQANLQTELEQIKDRDRQDLTRATSPLHPAPDALVLDTTSLSLEQVVETILTHLAGLEHPFRLLTPSSNPKVI